MSRIGDDVAADPMDVSVVVVTYRSEAYVEACLTALEVALTDVRAEVVVVDNASGDGVADVVRASLPTAIFRARDVNDGFGRGCHVGAELTSGRRLLMVNPDAVIDRDAVRALLSCAERTPRAGVIGGRSVHADGSTDARSWWGRPSLWAALCFATGLSSLLPGNRLFDPESAQSWNGREREVPVVSGALMLIERAAWDELGGFDRDYLLYGEDADLCLRARRAGWAPRVCPDATFQHRVGASSADSNRLPLVLRGRVTVLRRSQPGWRGRCASALLVVGTGLRAVSAGLRPDRGRPGSGAAAWRDAWQRRSQWRRGWQPGDSMTGETS